MKENYKVSFVVPCYNESGNISKLIDRIEEVFAGVNYEAILVNDGSKDDTLSVIRTIVDEKDYVTGVSFSRNFGKEAAIYAGISEASGEYTCLIDADMQQDPDVVLRMVKILEENSDVDCVCAVPAKRVENPLTNFVKSCFYKVINMMVTTKLEENASDFRTFRTNVRNSLIDLKENNRFSKGLFSWIGYNTVAIEYDVKPRESGETKWSLKSLINYAMTGIISFSVKPLKFSLWVGLIVTALSFVTGIYYIIELLTGVALTISHLLVFLVLLIGGMQFVFIGVVGLYLADIHIQSKDRPVYITKEVIKHE